MDGWDLPAIEEVIASRRDPERWPGAAAQDQTTSPSPGASAKAPKPDRRSRPGNLRRPEYLVFLERVATDLGDRRPTLSVKEIQDAISRRWDPATLGELSAKKLDVAATFLRPPEAQKRKGKPEG